MSLLHPSPKQVDRAQQIADLRAAVDWLEAHPDVDVLFSAIAIGDYGAESAAAFCCDDDVTVRPLRATRRFGTCDLSHGIPAYGAQLTPAEIRERVAK